MNVALHDIPSARLDPMMLAGLTRARSESGFLSLYLAVDYDDPDRWQAHARSRLQEVVAGLTGERRQRLERAVDQVLNTIESVAATAAEARSLVAFIDADADGPGMWLGLNMPARPSVSLSAHPRIAPLLSLLQRGAPVGVLETSHDTAVIAEWSAGVLRQLRSHREAPPAEKRRKLGPANTNPGHMNESMLLVDDHKRDVREHETAALVAWLTQVVTPLVRDRNWQRLVIFGPRDVTARTRKALGDQVEFVDGGSQIFVRQPLLAVRDRVRTVLAAEARVRELALVENVVSGNLAKSVVGYVPTDHAIAEGRASGVLIADAPLDEAAGTAAGEVGEGDVGVEGLIRRASGRGVDITIVHDDAAQMLRARGGVAAMLRY